MWRVQRLQNLLVSGLGGIFKRREGLGGFFRLFLLFGRGLLLLLRQLGLFGSKLGRLGLGLFAQFYVR